MPTDKQKLQDWLYERYFEKEKMLENYYETGSWKQYTLSEKQEDGIISGKFADIENERIVEQDLLRCLLLHAFFICSTYFHYAIAMVIIQCVVKLLL